MAIVRFAGNDGGVEGGFALAGNSFFNEAAFSNARFAHQARADEFTRAGPGHPALQACKFGLAGS